MPNIKSAKKRVEITAVKTLQNKMTKSALKTAVKKFDVACASGNKAEAEAAYADVIKKMDKAVAKGIVHKNNAARHKSQFTLKLNKIDA